MSVTAAGDTTRNVVAGGMEALFENPEERAILLAAADDPTAVAAAVEDQIGVVREGPVDESRRSLVPKAEITWPARSHRSTSARNTATS